MTKVTSREALNELRGKYRNDVLMRLLSYDSLNRREVTVSLGDCGLAAGGMDTLKALFSEVNAAGLEDVSVIGADCMGNCGDEPIVKITGPNQPAVAYKKVDAALAKEIVSKHLVGGTVVDHAKMEV